MNSLKVFSFKENIKNFIEEQALPKEVVRLCLAEIYREIEAEALSEILAQAQEREKKDASTHN